MDGRSDNEATIWSPFGEHNNGQIKVKIRAMSPIFNPTIQQLIIHVYTKSQDPSLNTS